MYAYNLLVESPDRKADEGRWDPVRPGPDLEILTLAALREQLKHDLGFVPEWAAGLDPTEYVQVEEDVEVMGVWFLLDIEGSQDHVLPPLAQRVAWRVSWNRGRAG